MTYNIYTDIYTDSLTNEQFAIYNFWCSTANHPTTGAAYPAM